MAIGYPSSGASDPAWVYQLKRLMKQVVEKLNSVVVRGDLRSTIVKDGTVTALPQFYPAKITGVIDANGYYPCSVYLAGTSDADPKAGEKLLLWNMDVLGTDLQGFYLVRPIVVVIGTTDTVVWEAVNTLPRIPGAAANYGLMCIAGKVQWVWAGACGVTTTTTATTTTTTTTTTAP
jgi:hypothetical protein